MSLFAHWIVQIFIFYVVAFNPVSDWFPNVVNIIFLPRTLGARASHALMVRALSQEGKTGSGPSSATQTQTQLSCFPELHNYSGSKRAH